MRTLARKVGLPHSTVHAILNASELQPHRLRTFTFSPDPEFEPKLLDIVGLYLNPPENALVLCVLEEKRCDVRVDNDRSHAAGSVFLWPAIRATHVKILPWVDPLAKAHPEDLPGRAGTR